MYFFRTEFHHPDQVKNQKEQDLMGWCILHVDHIKYGNGKIYPKLYVPVSIIQNPLGLRGFVFGTRKVTLKINGKRFRLEGNYFSQQNGITNCCAHAAIKMAVRGYRSEVTAEGINQVLGIDHVKLKGNKGLNAWQISSAISELTGLKAFPLYSSSLRSPLEFLKLIYFAMESRFPVILLFRFEKHGHAVTLNGHTLNEHNWLANALKEYFALGNKEALSSLPSFLWCDNFVIQDDNFGPSYLVSSRFLTDFPSAGGLLDALHNTVESITSSSVIRFNNHWVHMPMCAIFVRPRGLPNLWDTKKVEFFARDKLGEYIYNLDHHPTLKFLLQEEVFNCMFLKYHSRNNLILRTFWIKKKEYLQNSHGHPGMDRYRAELADFLPDAFWITEISVPELFWIRGKKVGEIITDSKRFADDYSEGVIFIRLPNILAFVDKDQVRNQRFSNEEIMLPMIRPRGLWWN